VGLHDRTAATVVRIAYFSPFPPKRTGIALYSEQLAQSLRSIMEVHCFDFDNSYGSDAAVTFADFARRGRIQELAQYDAVVYQLGNNPHFHLRIFETLRQFPGMVVLHDTVLYYLFAGLGRAGLIKHLWLCEGRSGAASIHEILEQSAEHDILRYPHAERHPLTASVFPYATRIVVHNMTAKHFLQRLGYSGAVHVIPHLAFPSVDSHASIDAVEKLRRQHQIASDELVVSCLGFIGHTKRIPQVCRALARLNGDIKFRFVIAGEGDDLTACIEEAGLRDLTIRVGYVDSREFSQYLALTDVLVNLRYPNRGESSGTLTRAMALGKPAIVTDEASFSELPADVVYKISAGPNEQDELAAAIRRLATDAELRQQLGTAAHAYVARQLNPDRIARSFKQIVEREIRERAQNELLSTATSNLDRQVATTMLKQTLLRALPEGLLRNHLNLPEGD
jgi:glycosyltransferase involved in cell wall biosynthesis